MLTNKEIFFQKCPLMSIIFLSIQHPVLIGRTADTLLKKPGEMLRIFKSQIISHLGHRFLQIKNPFFGNINYFGLSVLLGRFAGFFFDNIPKIISRIDIVEEE